MTERSQALAGTERLRPVSVPKAVATFLLAGLIVLTTVGVMLALAERRSATAEAIRDARTVTNLEAADVVGPVLRDEALVPGAAYEELDRVIRDRVLGSHIVRVKIWDATGRIVYSDDAALVGLRFSLGADELTALRSGRTTAEVTDLSGAENRDERSFGKLLQVYLGVKTPTGTRLLFETYQPYQVITDASRRMLGTSLPVLLSGLVLLYLVQAPLAYRMARRLKRSQDEREALLLASLAASDRERVTIAADLHDGVVQGLAGASFSLAAGAERARRFDPTGADTMAVTAADLRRWVRELRSLVVTITPPALHAQGLAAALVDLVATLEVRGLSVTVDVNGTEGLDQSTETLVYRAAQEAVRNIVRHADAGTATLSVARSGTGGSDRREELLVLRVRDDGRGFDATEGSARRRGSVGLELLNALVTSHRGTLTVEATPGQGTELVLRLPVAAENASRVAVAPTPVPEASL
ncbi:MAG: integral rane sensor signal transduction histidine kinase [Frankiales bacterium]|nr:integral rane sensor signal transduction histidine kinase [Frankiales bacterium]